MRHFDDCYRGQKDTNFGCFNTESVTLYKMDKKREKKVKPGEPLGPGVNFETG
jgi:hypothetical protein